MTLSDRTGFRSWLLAVFLTLVTMPICFSSASAFDDLSPIGRLNDFFTRLHTIEAEFVQQIYESDNQTPSVSRGLFSAKKPGLFRWDYSEPFEQVILSDADSVYFYEVDLAQVTKSSAARLEQTPAAFFVSDRPLSQTFALSVTEDSTWHVPGVRLVPLKEGSIQEIVLTLHPQKDELLNLQVLDSLGNHSRFGFQNVRFNQPLPEDRFVFVRPPEVDLIEETPEKTGL
ncbi:MAG: outer-membrane lipoprotein carrier protein LolA [Magnetococcales bacterium]|nr:outer-membrane lipoprotein carrier protein LolA [Magnetococcales bacterium]